MKTDCISCKGTGRGFFGGPCGNCNGSGRVSDFVLACQFMVAVAVVIFMIIAFVH